MSSPDEIALKFIDIGKTKTSLKADKAFVLAIFAGMFIAFAGIGYTVAGATVENQSLAKFIGACVFPGGLAMVSLAGSELFTGNCLIFIPVLNKDVKITAMLKNWAIVFVGNLIGSLIVAFLVVYSGIPSLFNNAVAQYMVSVAGSTAALSPISAVFRGILCNFLVCTAVWITVGSKDAAGKVLGLFFPIMIFVLCGFEHSVANMYYIPTGLMASAQYGIESSLSLLTCAQNIIFVSIGNIIGGSVMFASGYWFSYLKERQN